MTSWKLTIKDRHRINRQRTVTFETKPSDYTVAFEKGTACYNWYCMPHELDTTLEEFANE